MQKSLQEKLEAKFYGLSVLVQRYDHSARTCEKGSFSPDGASVLSFSPYMHIPPYTSDKS